MFEITLRGGKLSNEVAQFGQALCKEMYFALGTV
jgi:hypothetical protein